MVRTFEAAPGITAIDTRMGGHENVTSAYLVDAEEPALIETGPTTSADEVVGGLLQLGVGPQDLAHIVVTHIHLDHAGGAGRVAPAFPRATVWVHERGAPHLADPSRLMASAIRIYGEERLHELFGPVEPVPEDRLRVLPDDGTVPLGDRSLTSLHTPGHASHHVALQDSSTGGVFVGDALGVFLPDVRILRPATPPPEFDLELTVASIRRIQERQPTSILFSHFGPAAEVVHLCELAMRRVERWTAVVADAMEATEDLAEIVERLRGGTASELNPTDDAKRQAVEERYELLSSFEMNALGIRRYLQKRAERPG